MKPTRPDPIPWPRGGSATLRTAASMLRDSPLPQLLAWRTPALRLRNDAWTAFATQASHGGPGPRDAGDEPWPELEATIARVMASGEAAVEPRGAAPPIDAGALPRHVTCSFGPVREDDGAVGGVLVTVVESTGHATAEQAGRRRAGQLQALASAALAVTAAPTLQATLDAVTLAAREIVGAHQAVVSMTRGPDWSQSINSVAMSDAYGRWRGFEAATDGSGIYAWLCEQNRPVRMTQAELEARPRWRGFGRHAPDHPPMRGWLAVPLVAKDGRNLGLIQLSDRADGGDFDASDEAIVVQLAQFAAAAIEQARTSDTLRESESRLRLAIEAFDLGTFDFYPQTGESWWSPRMNALFGHPPERTLARADLLERIHPDDRELHARTFARALDPDGDGHYGCEYRVLDGAAERWVSIDARVRFEERAGTRVPVRVTGVALDTTERQRTIERLRQSEERFRLVADVVPQIVWVTDAEGRTEFFNRQWVEYTGVPYDPSTATEVALRFVHPDDGARTMAAFDEARRTGGGFEVEHRIRSSTGEYRWFLVRAQPYRDASGRIVRWFGVSIDIHDRRMSEERLREADRAKDEFLSMLAHELRGPLGPIRTGFALLGHETLSERGRQVLRMGQRQLRHVSRLVDDLLEVSRVTRGMIELRPEPVMVQHVLYGVADAFAATLDERRQRIDFEMPAQPLRLLADPVRLAQIVENLLSNASKYTGTGGRIAIRVRERSDAVEIEVEDTGIGIAPEHLAKLFDLFVQVDTSIDRSRGGLGIGLALVRRLVELHRGSVTAHSAGPGRGSTFTVRLPRGDAPAVHEWPPAAGT